MQFRQKTVAQARMALGRLMLRGKYTTGHVIASPAPTTTAFSLEEAKIFPDDHFQGYIVYCLSGTGAGQSGYVSQSDSGTGVLTIAPAVALTFDTTSLLEIIPDQTTPAEILNALNLAAETISSQCDVYVETTSPTLDSEYRVVTVPSSYIKLCVVRYRDSGGIWRVFRYSHSPEQPGQEQGKDFTLQGRLVYLSEPIPGSIPGSDIVISGYRLPAEMVLDSDPVEVPISYLVFEAAGLLEQGLAGNVDVDPEGHGSRATGWLASALRERATAPYINYLPNTIILDTPGS